MLAVRMTRAVPLAAAITAGLLLLGGAAASAALLGPAGAPLPSGPAAHAPPGRPGATVPDLPAETLVAAPPPSASQGASPTAPPDRVAAEPPEAARPASLGRPERGALWNGARLTSDAALRVVESARPFGTEETIRSLRRAAALVASRLPHGPPLLVGDLSAEHGGPIRPHRSHQSGRDADLGYYYRGGGRWYQRANANNLDRPRTWALLSALAEDPNLEVVFMDRSVQRFLREHAEDVGAAPSLLRRLFVDQPGAPRLVRHEWGHVTHLHVRFRSPEACALGERVGPELVAEGRLPPHVTARLARAGLSPRARAR